ncbi:MAG: rhodanese-like domain-containing protein [Gemmatimonadota bacterium]|jgi:phage shock protein E
MSLRTVLSRLFSDPSRLPPADFVSRRRPGDGVLDVRTPREFADGHLRGAINVDLQGPDFAARVEKLARKGRIPTDGPIYLYCRSGARSGRATRLLREAGFREAYNVGGFLALRRAGAEVRE